MAEKKVAQAQDQAQEKKAYKRRTKEEQIADLDKKIQYHLTCIDSLNNQKEGILQGSMKEKRKALLDKVKDMTLEEMAEKLGVSLA